MHLLFYYTTHTVRQVVAHGIQKREFRLLFLLGQSSHRNKLLIEPLVCLAQLAHLNGLTFLIHDLNDELTQTFMKLHAVLLRVA